ncbi:MAG: sortase [Actinomycetota bacterium]|nr:sortase [Actinomycetota bacterium]
MRSLGVALLLAGVAVAVYQGWLYWGTGLSADRANTDLRRRVIERIDDRARHPERPAPRPVAAPRAPAASPPAGAIAILRIPSIGVNHAVVEGTDSVDLNRGPGHYTSTAYPWQDRGRVGIAGHRTTYGAPFWSLDELRAGDEVRLLTARGTFTYVVRGQREVAPSRTGVLAPTRRPTLVLTTCSPRFSDARRLVVSAVRRPPTG